nr:MAG TPA: hypothetical protein [Bacteriophage sp.]
MLHLLPSILSLCTTTFTPIATSVSFGVGLSYCMRELNF